MAKGFTTMHTRKQNRIFALVSFLFIKICSLKTFLMENEVALMKNDVLWILNKKRWIKKQNEKDLMEKT